MRTVQPQGASPPSNSELMEAEDGGWDELHQLVASLSQEIERPVWMLGSSALSEQAS
jgi:hypothetical protein